MAGPAGGAPHNRGPRRPVAAVPDVQGGERAAYAELGIANYWLVDPDMPSIQVLERHDGTYVEIGTARGDEAITIQRPFPVTLVPARLVVP